MDKEQRAVSDEGNEGTEGEREVSQRPTQLHSDKRQQNKKINAILI